MKLDLKGIEGKGVQILESDGEFTTSIKSSQMESGKNKVQLYLMKNQVKVARLAFVLAVEKALFSGFFVNEDFRQQGLATRLFNEFTELANINNLDISETTVQEKPFVCYLLKIWGYDPVSTSAMDRIDIAVEKGPPRILLHFSDTKTEEKYIRSRNSSSQTGVEIVHTTPDNAETLFLRSSYKK